MPLDQQKKIFDSFSQADNTSTRQYGGTGLGLAIVGRILEEHGGRIELRDAAEKIPGQRGAWMRLRIATEPAPAAEAAKPELSKTASER